MYDWLTFLAVWETCLPQPTFKRLPPCIYIPALPLSLETHAALVTLGVELIWTAVYQIRRQRSLRDTWKAHRSRVLAHRPPILAPLPILSDRGTLWSIIIRPLQNMCVCFGSHLQSLSFFHIKTFCPMCWQQNIYVCVRVYHTRA